MAAESVAADVRVNPVGRSEPTAARAPGRNDWRSRTTVAARGEGRDSGRPVPPGSDCRATATAPRGLRGFLDFGDQMDVGLSYKSDCG